MKENDYLLPMEQICCEEKIRKTPLGYAAQKRSVRIHQFFHVLGRTVGMTLEECENAFTDFIASEGARVPASLCRIDLASFRFRCDNVCCGTSFYSGYVFTIRNGKVCFFCSLECKLAQDDECSFSNKDNHTLSDVTPLALTPEQSEYDATQTIRAAPTEKLDGEMGEDANEPMLAEPDRESCGGTQKLFDEPATAELSVAIEAEPEENPNKDEAVEPETDEEGYVFGSWNPRPH